MPTGQRPGEVSPDLSEAGRRPVLAAALVATGGLIDVLNSTIYGSSTGYVMMTDQGLVQLDISVWERVHAVTGLIVLLTALVILADRPWSAWVSILILTGITVDTLFIPFDPLQELVEVTIGALGIVLLLRHRRLRRLGR